VYVHTLGCPKNDADSRGLMRYLISAGATVVNDPDASTHILVNTCGFIREAKEESIDAILSACAQYSDKTLLVMGCLVERYRDELRKSIPEVAAWFGLADADLHSRVSDAVLGDEGTQHGQAGGHRLSGKAYAYLKISDGCDEGCSFCAIPGIKGPYRSASTAVVLREAEACLSEGARELILVGQDTTRWKSEGLDLSGLIDLLASDDRVRRIRVMYLQPARIDEAFLEFMRDHEKLCRYVDVPFQHSHPDLLRRMGRLGDGETYLALLGHARRLMPDVSLRSTFIVGFPGETEGEFAHL
jgi:ribosomal protein S12 methylthiotransferase